MQSVTLCRTALIAATVAGLILMPGCSDDDGGGNDNDATVTGCGNGVVEQGEECDDGVNNSDTEPDRCRTDCSDPRCGDDVADTGEECDGQDLQLMSCTDFGSYTGGTLTCTQDCHFDQTDCSTCGNALVETGEVCDGTNLQGLTCNTAGGFDAGALACDANCDWDFSGCYTCGDSICQPMETVTDCPADCQVVAVTAGYNHTCAIVTHGQAYCWGGNAYGQLGNGLGGDSNLPSPVTGLDDAVAVYAGGGFYSAAIHTCGLWADGSPVCWGDNGFDQLGDGTGVESNVPVAVTGLTDVVQISAGASHSCAVKTDGSVWCWGDNYYGQLGNGTSGAGTESLVPVAVLNIGNAVYVGTGEGYSCALLDDGRVRCWGRDVEGALGNDSAFTNQSTPVWVNGVTTGVFLSVGPTHSCVALADETFGCWGNNQGSQIGDGTTNNHPTPYYPLLPNIIAISAGWRHTCALRASGEARCWGDNTEGQLGLGHNNPIGGFPTSADLLDLAVISAGRWHTCAITFTGTLKCWGQNTSGQLGTGDFSTDYLPTLVEGL